MKRSNILLNTLERSNKISWGILDQTGVRDEKAKSHCFSISTVTGKSTLACVSFTYDVCLPSRYMLYIVNRMDIRQMKESMSNSIKIYQMSHTILTRIE